MLDSKDDQIKARFALITIHLSSRCLMEFGASYVFYVLVEEIKNQLVHHLGVLEVHFRYFLGKIN